MATRYLSCQPETRGSCPRSVIAAANGSTSYLFDALGHRIQDPKLRRCHPIRLRRFGNDANTNALLTTRFYLQGAVIASLAAGGTLNFEHRDWLGTLRMLTNSSGAQIGNYSSFPYGDGYTYNGVDGDMMHFAVLDHDSLTNTDHAEARDYDEGPGRWLSPDPSSSSYDWSDPQSLNRYSYATNNPLNLIDPSGLFTQGSGGSECGLCSVFGDIIVQGLEGLFSLFEGGPSFHGSFKPRPSGATGATGDVTIDENGNYNLYVNAYATQLAYAPLALPIPSFSASSIGNRIQCAAKFGQAHSIGAAFGGGTVANFLGGNSVSSIVNIFSKPSDVVSGGLGLPVNDVLRLTGGQPQPLYGSLAGSIRSSAIEGAVNSFLGTGDGVVSIAGETSLASFAGVATSAATAAEAASVVGIAKFGLDALTVLYGGIVACAP